MYEDKHQTLYRILAAALFVLICAGMMIYAHLKSPPEPVDAANWRRVEMLKTEVFSRIRAPWDKDRQSIHSFLRSFEREAGSGPLPAAAMVLPDEEAFNARWRDGSPDAARPGSLDTAYISLDVTGGDEAGAISEKLCRQLRAVMERPNSQTVADMHESLLALDSLIPYIDAMREVAQEPVPNEAFLYEYGEWLVKECPDRNPVKLGIILRGLFNRAGYSAIFTLARHDEFTLFALHAQSANLQNTPVYEDAVWTMAKRVKGWGRVQAVLRLFDTENPEIRKWLLREGYANEVDIAILAFGCAQTGGLLRELEAEAIDADLLIGGGEILSTLFAGGGIADYWGGRGAARLYLGHLLAATPGDPRLHRYAETILEFAGEPDAPYWDETIAQLARQCVERHSPASRSAAADGGKGEI